MEKSDIGLRITEERTRIGYNLTSFARIIGISRVALRSIEDGESDFKVSVLIALQSIGADIFYILSGNRNITEIKNKENNIGTNVINGDVVGVGVAQTGSNVHFINTQKITHTTKPVTVPGVEHITIEQRAVLKSLVDDVVELETRLKKTPKTHRAVWASLNKHCSVPSYSLIALTDFDKARKYLSMWIGRLNAAPTAKTNDVDKWRKRMYAYIKVNTKSKPDADAVSAYMARKYKADSLTQLSDDQLNEVYRYVASRK